MLVMLKYTLILANATKSRRNHAKVLYLMESFSNVTFLTIIMTTFERFCGSNFPFQTQAVKNANMLVHKISSQVILD